MADLPAEGRANLERQKRFLLAVTVIVAAYFLLGARVCDTATYSGFLVTIARPENARDLLLIVWGWALLTYCQRLYKLHSAVRESVQTDVDAEDMRLAVPVARRFAWKDAKTTDLERHYGPFTVDPRVEIGLRPDADVGKKKVTEALYASTYGGRLYTELTYILRGNSKQAGQWSTTRTVPMTWSPRFTRWHRFRSWLAALVRRPALTEHYGPLVAVALTVCLAALYWNNPPHPSECRPTDQISAPHY